MPVANHQGLCAKLEGECPVEPWNLAVWLPLLLGLGLVTMGLLFAFVLGCDKV
jgi:hypothetical protein